MMTVLLIVTPSMAGNEVFDYFKNLTNIEGGTRVAPFTAKSAFRDTKTKDWYTGAVGAAVEAGIIQG